MSQMSIAFPPWDGDVATRAPAGRLEQRSIQDLILDLLLDLILDLILDPILDLIQDQRCAVDPAPTVIVTSVLVASAPSFAVARKT